MDHINFVSTYTKEFENMSYKARTDSRTLFRDAVTYLASFYRLQIEGHKQEVAEEYNQMLSKYSEDVIHFFKLFVLDLTKMLSVYPKDYLGELFQKIGANSSHLGQFYTPSHVSSLMAEVTLGDADFTDKDKPFTICDPCCGSGSMLIGAIIVLEKKGVNYASDTMLYATDIDRTAAYMCYLQLNLLGAAAVVTCGDSLMGDVRDTMGTFAAYYQSYVRRLNEAE